ncbi:MAG: hypothetical protein LBB94_08575 [Clostridiales bacterium]|jgi:hypothetical protein|nr:hypothetical protein [Clostridiales bacterium]
MDNFLLRLKILDGILETKVNLLKQILSITENQRCVLTAGSRGDSVPTLLAGMNDEKQKLIETLNENDKVFERTYHEIRPVFEVEARKREGLVRRIQDGIKRVTALDTRIRVLEARNSAERPAAKQMPDTKSARKRVALIYEKNKNFHQISGGG